jgi:cytosine deaminase
MDLIVRNARLQGQTELVDLAVRDGLLAEIGARLSHAAEIEIDAGGDLVSPPFIDPHLHLDAALTAGTPRYNISGSHPEGIQVWGEYKRAFPDFADLKDRARQAVNWEVSQGTLCIRTHIDVCDPNLTALHLMLELREELRDLVEIQIVAFPQDGILAYPQTYELMAEALSLGADLVGGIPHCEWTREDGIASLELVYDLAEKYDKMIDVHCDETDDPHSRFLEVLAALSLRRGFQGRVSAGHTTAMHSYNNAYAHKLQGLLRQAEISIIANPFDNTVLQARFDTYPKRRGITRVKELLAAGVNVCLGHDSIMDPWYPLGRGDMLAAARLAVHVCHMTGYEEMQLMYDAITSNAAKAFGIADRYGLKPGMRADFIILDTQTVIEAVRLSPVCRYVIKAGRIVARTEPAISRIHRNGQIVPVDFRRNLYA